MKKIMLLSVFSICSVLFFSCKKEIKEQNVNMQASVSEVKKEVPQKKGRKAKFNYQPEKPVNGKMKAAVELGASGFNSFIIELDKEKNWEIKSKEFGNSLILEGLTNAIEVNTKLRAYIQKILEFGVDVKDVHFIVSSGADKEPVTKLIKQELKKIGYVVNTVTAEEEGQYALKSILPKRFEQTAFVIDIGSGNTKISYIEGENIIGRETYGAKYFQKDAKDTKVYEEVNKLAATIPLKRRAQCFIIGGVPYNMAKSLKEGKERFTVLNKDISTYQKIVEKKGKKVASGLNIFKAINDAAKPNSVIFDWDANFTIGFILDLPY